MGNRRFKNQQLEYWERTAVLTASFCVARSCIWQGIVFRTDGNNNITVNVYDNNVVAASAVRLWPDDYIVVGADRKHVISCDPGFLAHQGITVIIAVAGGGTCGYQIFYNAG